MCQMPNGRTSETVFLFLFLSVRGHQESNLTLRSEDRSVAKAPRRSHSAACLFFKNRAVIYNRTL
jgi:hypothetical protein